MNKRILTTSIIAGAMIGLAGCGSTGNPTDNATGKITKTNAKSVAQPINKSIKSSTDIVKNLKKIDISGFKGLVGNPLSGKLMKSVLYNEVGTETHDCNNGGTVIADNKDTTGDGNPDTQSITFNNCQANGTTINGKAVAKIIKSDTSTNISLTVSNFKATNVAKKAELSIKGFNGAVLIADHGKIKNATAKGTDLFVKDDDKEAKITSLDANMTGNIDKNGTIKIVNSAGYIKEGSYKNSYDITSLTFTHVYNHISYNHYYSADLDFSFNSTPSCFNGSIGVKTNKTIKISDSSDTEPKITEGEITFTASNSHLTITSNTDGSFDIKGVDTKHLADQDALEDYFDTNDSTSCQAE